jgi:hypothetical protein
MFKETDAFGVHPIGGIKSAVQVECLHLGGSRTMQSAKGAAADFVVMESRSWRSIITDRRTQYALILKAWESALLSASGRTALGNL